MSSSPWLVWQLVDSAFPTGAFAHSGGLESAWQLGQVAGADDVWQYVQDSVLQAGSATLPLVNAVHRAPERVAAMDALADAFLINAVANRASRVQGRSLLATAARVWPGQPIAALQEALADRSAHVAPVTGAVFGALGVPLETAQHVVLFGAARIVLSAAVRLGIVGSYEAQRLQAAVGLFAAKVQRRVADATDDDLAHTAPLVDLFQGAHDRLYSRLFQS
jgi:urease accessory protein